MKVQEKKKGKGVAVVRLEMYRAWLMKVLNYRGGLPSVIFLGGKLDIGLLVVAVGLLPSVILAMRLWVDRTRVVELKDGSLRLSLSELCSLSLSGWLGNSS